MHASSALGSRSSAASPSADGSGRPGAATASARTSAASSPSRSSPATGVAPTSAARSEVGRHEHRVRARQGEVVVVRAGRQQHRHRIRGVGTRERGGAPDGLVGGQRHERQSPRPAQRLGRGKPGPEPGEAARARAHAHRLDIPDAGAGGPERLVDERQQWGPAAVGHDAEHGGEHTRAPAHRHDDMSRRGIESEPHEVTRRSLAGCAVPERRLRLRGS